MISHFKFDSGSVNYVGVGEERFGQFPTVELYRLDIFVVLGITFYVNHEFLASGEGYFGMREPRPADGIHRFAGAYLIESERVKYIPGRHLAAVFITRQTVDVVAILLLST